MVVGTVKSRWYVSRYYDAINKTSNTCVSDRKYLSSLFERPYSSVLRGSFNRDFNCMNKSLLIIHYFLGQICYVAERSPTNKAAANRFATIFGKQSFKRQKLTENSERYLDKSRLFNNIIKTLRKYL